MDFEEPSSSPADSQSCELEENKGEDEEKLQQNETKDAYDEGSVMYGPESEHILKEDKELMDDKHSPSQFDIELELAQHKPNTEFDLDGHSDVQFPFNFGDLDETNELLGEDGCEDINCETFSGVSSGHEDVHLSFANTSQNGINSTNNSSATERMTDAAEYIQERQLSVSHLTQEVANSSFDLSGLSNIREADITNQDDTGPSKRDSDLSKGLQPEVGEQSVQLESESNLKGCDFLVLMDVEDSLKTLQTQSKTTRPSDGTSIASEILFQNRECHSIENTQNMQTSSEGAQTPSHQKQELQQLFYDKYGDMKHQAIETSMKESEEINVLSNDLHIDNYPNSEAVVDSSGFAFARDAGVVSRSVSKDQVAFISGNSKGYLEVACSVVQEGHSFPHLQEVEKDNAETLSELQGQCGETHEAEAPSCRGTIIEGGAYCQSVKLKCTEDIILNMDLSSVSDNQTNGQSSKAFKVTERGAIVLENKIGYIEEATMDTKDTLHEVDASMNSGGPSSEVVAVPMHSRLSDREAETLPGNIVHHNETNIPLEGSFDVSASTALNSSNRTEKKVDEAIVAKTSDEAVSDDKMGKLSNSVDTIPELCTMAGVNQADCEMMGSLHDRIDTSPSLLKGQMNQTFQTTDKNSTGKHGSDAEEISESLIEFNADLGKESDSSSGHRGFSLVEEGGSATLEELKEEQKEPVYLDSDSANRHVTVLETDKHDMVTASEDSKKDENQIILLPTSTILVSARMVPDKEDDSSEDGSKENADNNLDITMKEMEANPSKLKAVHGAVCPHTDTEKASRLNRQSEISIQDDNHSDNPAAVPHVQKDDADILLKYEKPEENLNRVDLTAYKQDVNALVNTSNVILTDANIAQTNSKGVRVVAEQEAGIGRTAASDALFDFQDHKTVEVVAEPVVLTIDSESARLSGVNQTVGSCVQEEKKNDVSDADLVDRKYKDKLSEEVSLETSILANSMDEKGKTASQSMSGLDSKPSLIKRTSLEEYRIPEAAPMNSGSADGINHNLDNTMSSHGKEERTIVQVPKVFQDGDLKKRIVDTVDSYPSNQSSLVEQADFTKEASVVRFSQSRNLQPIQTRLIGPSETGSESPKFGVNMTCLAAKVDSSTLNGAEIFTHCLPQADKLPVERFEDAAKLLNASETVVTAASPVLDANSSVPSDLRGLRTKLPEETICPTVVSSPIIDGASSRSQLAHPLEQVTIPDLNVTEAASSARAVQPFTDAQQVQLRAQILVYGSLIQGAVPDEALMAPAFKDTNGGRPDIERDTFAGDAFWEKAWRAALDRIKGRSTFNAPKEAAQSVIAGVLPGRMPEEGQRRSCFSLNPSVGNTSCEVDARSHPVSTVRFPELSGPKSHVSRMQQNPAVTTTARIGVGSTPVPFQNHSHQINFPSTRVLPSPYSEAMQNSLGSRSAQLDSVKLPFRAGFSNPQVTSFITGTTHWVSPAPLAGTEWLPPAQTGFDATASFTPLQPFAARDGSQDLLNSKRNISTPRIPFVPVAAAIAATSNVGEVNNIAAVQKGNTGSSMSPDHRSRKRKKSQMDLSVQCDRDTSVGPGIPMWCSSSSQAVACPVSLPNAALTTFSEALSIVVATSHFPSPVVQVPFTSTKTIGPSATLPSCPNRLNSLASQYQLSSGRENQRLTISEISADDLEQAKLMAEEATSYADGAMKHCESLWNRLQSQKISGIITEKEAKLASSAVAISAAASVAKAAAAAGRIAYEAALQAKLMGEEALETSDGANYISYRSKKVEKMLIQGSSGADHVGKETVSGTFGTQVTSSNFVSVITNVKEVAKKRLQDASAAKMRAHNIEAVVKAAELAARAVSHAGAVVAISEHSPFTLDMLLDAGPHGLHQLVNTETPDHMLQAEKPNLVKGSRRSSGRREKESKDKGSKEAKDWLEDGKLEKSSEQGRPECKTGGLSKTLDNDKEQRVNKACNVEIVTRCTDMVAIVTTQASTEIICPNNEGTLPGKAQVGIYVSSASYPNSAQIEEGSIVEVLSDEEGLRGVWFSARVKAMENGRALVVYDELLSDDNSFLEEWVDLGTPAGEAPKIRLAHPMTKIKFEGTRKRRRAAMGIHDWSVGDRVDAWIKDGWWEGEVIEKSEDDETKIKVHFPGEGDTTLIKPWNLRPSLLWKDGYWLLWTDIKLESQNNQVEVSGLKDESHAAKRLKVDTTVSGENHPGKQQKVDEVLKDTEKRVIEKAGDVKLGEVQGSQKLNSSASAGDPAPLKNTGMTRENLNGKELRMKQAIQGSKVVFGVPKPSKGRKFIEVSKHYGPSRMPEISHKISKHEVAVSKNQISSNNGNRDPDGGSKKQSRPTTSKAKDSNQSKRVLITHGKKPSGTDVDSKKQASVHGAKFGKKSTVPDMQETDVQKSNILPATTTMPIQASMQKQAYPSRNIVSSTDADSLNNNHLVFSKKKVEKEKAVTQPSAEFLEPRRSSRRIQPTSKLLEGLESTPRFG